MTASTRAQLIQRQVDWEASHGPWCLERALRGSDDYVLNPEGSWGEGVYGPMVHNANCWTFDPETVTALPHLTWAEVKDLETQRRAGEPISFCGHCVARNDQEDFETWAARTLAAAREADPGLTGRVAARRAARRAERGDRWLY